MSALLDRAHEKASPRRFTGEPITGFGHMPTAEQIRAAGSLEEFPDLRRWSVRGIALAVIAAAVAASAFWPWGVAP